MKKYEHADVLILFHEDDLERLRQVSPFSPEFQALKEEMKEQVLSEDLDSDGGWEEDWQLEVALMTFLFGEGWQ